MKKERRNYQGLEEGFTVHVTLRRVTNNEDKAEENSQEKKTLNLGIATTQYPAPLSQPFPFWRHR